MPFYGAAARLRFHTAKTQSSCRSCGPIAMQQTDAVNAENW